MLSSILKLGVNIGLLFFAIFIVYFTLFGKNLLNNEGVFKQDSKSGNWDLATTFGREIASIEKPVSPFEVKKCGEVKHTDGEIMTFCLVEFNGTSGGFYDAGKNLMVVGSFSEVTLVHEIFHAASIHNYNKGYTEMLTPVTQERMAYDAENLIMQIRAFQEDMAITPDLGNEKKQKLGLPVNAVYATNVATSSKILNPKIVPKNYGKNGKKG